VIQTNQLDYKEQKNPQALVIWPAEKKN